MSLRLKPTDFSIIAEFECNIADFFGAPYAIAFDSCTHSIEVCLRYTNTSKINVPKRTYISIPFLANKIGIELKWRDENWQDYYYQKHLSLGRGGIILTDNKEAAVQLKKMSYDGRLPNIPWRDQNIDTIGYHYYMTPETAQLGLDKLSQAIQTPPRQWVVSDWPDLTQMNIFKNTL